jgi:hypothetical protein
MGTIQSPATRPTDLRAEIERSWKYISDRGNYGRHDV